MPNEFPKEILKSCDIRGIYPKPLGDDQAYLIGQAVGTLLKSLPDRNIKAVVGGDIRASTPPLRKNLILGLKESGMKVYDAGQASTPLLAFATRFLKAGAGLIVTASHNPPEYNGVKFFLSSGPAPSSWIEKVYEIIATGPFKRGAGIVEPKDFVGEYRNAIVQGMKQSLRSVKLVVDAGNGMAALTVPPVLDAMGCRYALMNGRMDGQFPGRGADSSQPAGLRKLAEKVVHDKADLGLSFDGDADRVSFADGKGRLVPNDFILGLLAEHFLPRAKAPKVVYDAKCSDWVDARVRAAGGQPLMERAGHSFIYSRMQREKALLGGEASGHFFIPGQFPGDALYTALVLLGILKERNASLALLFDSYPERVSTHDVKIEMTSEALPGLYEDIESKARAMGGEISTVDGVRAVFKEGWGILRASVTEPVLSCRFEAPNRKKLTALVGELLKDHPLILEKVMQRIDKDV